MFVYTKPLCKTGSKLVKSRCECKKTVKDKTVKKNDKKTIKKTIKKKITKKGNKKSYSYDDEWATQRPLQYMSRMPSKAQLKVRRRRIDEVYKLHEMMKKINKEEISPDIWRYPPQRCYDTQLKDVIKQMKSDLKQNFSGNV